MGKPTSLPKDLNFFKDMPRELLAHIAVQSGLGVKFGSVSKATEEAVKDAAASCLTILSEYLKEEPENPIYKALKIISAEKNSIARIGKVYEELKRHGYDLKEGFKTLDAAAILTNFQEKQDRALVISAPKLEVTLGLKAGSLGGSAKEIRKWLNSNQELILTRKHIFVDHSQLDILPSEVGMFIGGEILALFQNHLEDLPFEIGKLQNLKMVVLTKNKFKKLPLVLTELPNLDTLYLNKLPGLSLINISKCKNLKILELEYNKYNADSLPQELYELENLEALSLSDNKFTSLPSGLLKLKKLKSLDLEDNPLQMSFEDQRIIAALRDRGCSVVLEREET